jgi:hypothetical protein
MDIAFPKQPAPECRMERGPKPRAGTIVMAVAGLAFLLLYIAFIAQDFAAHDGPGDSVVGDAVLTLGTLAALWILLLALLVADQIRKGPAWRRAAILLVPIAGIATLFATDYPNNALCELSLVALTLIVGAYLLLGWLPDRARGPAGKAQAVMLLLMAALSVYPIDIFVS